MNNLPPAFSRLALITGEEVLEKASKAKVIIFGLGGVGSWCAEALVRSGIGNITIVDSDVVCVTNINRQVQATEKTVGQQKAIALKNHLESIYGGANISAIAKAFKKETLTEFSIKKYDFVIDAIDSLSNKLDLLQFCVESGTTVFSCMGMAQKMDPTKIKIAKINKTNGCPLAKLVRYGLRKRGVKADFKAVYSEERLPIKEGVKISCGSSLCYCPTSGEKDCNSIDWCAQKKIINGSSVTVTAAAGMALASLVLFALER
ncbi:MAG: tRNA threonylcarbamoyladenosine dehydratase [Termitinemataceae bacterium]|nr:MAG: tRNA threonylcarbamoyladenosine dehydratase [Termitinemataceae bacterium]